MLRTVLCLTAFLASPLVRADVLVVDDDGGRGVDFTQIQAAVTAAAPGDTILVADGGYIGFTVDGKSLVIAAAQGASVAINGAVRIQDLAAGASVVLHGLDAETLTNGSALVVSNCAGPVWVEDGTFSGPALPQFGAPGVLVEGSAAVSFHRCVLEGARALNEQAGAGLRATASNVYLFDSDALGGDGASSLTALAAGPGALATGGVLYASGGTLAGGAGSDGDGIFGCIEAGDGGAGLVLDGVGSSAQLLDVLAQGGAAGPATSPCGPGVPGPGVDAGAGELLEQSFPARSVSADGPVGAGQPLTITVDGVPGDFVLLVVSRLHQPTFFDPTTTPPFPLLGGPLLPALSSTLLLEFGLIGPSGTLQAFLVAPPLPQEVTLFMQAVVVAPTPEAELVFSAGQTLTILP